MLSSELILKSRTQHSTLKTQHSASDPEGNNNHQKNLLSALFFLIFHLQVLNTKPNWYESQPIFIGMHPGDAVFH
jgi:hypothetical protein